MAIASSEKEPKRGRGRPRKLDDDYRAFTVRIGAGLYKQLRHFAVDQDASLNDVAAKAIEEWWRDQPERAKYARRPAPAKG
jgi:predicted HicB family RNase H-like nuclease